MTEFRSAPLNSSNFKARRITITPFIRQLPTDAIGGSDDTDLATRLITLRWHDIREDTDIPTRNNNRNSFRGFFRHRGKLNTAILSIAEVGDVIIFERLGSYEFRLHIEKPDGTRISGAPAPSPAEDRKRSWVMRETRPDQQKFRQAIVDRDGLKCAISACDIPEILDAAHLHAYAEGGSSDPSNGIILRKDLHGLFDSGLLRIGPDGAVTIDTDVVDPTYTEFEGKIVSTKADLTNLVKRDSAHMDFNE